MKKAFQFGCTGIIGLIVLGVIAGVLAGGGGDTSPKQETAQETAAEKKEEPKKEDANMVTRENYDKIVVGDSLTGDGGMTLEEVAAIFGADPETKSESQSGDMEMILASWVATGWENMGDNVNVTFINGKAAAKAQFGLDE